MTELPVSLVLLHLFVVLPRQLPVVADELRPPRHVTHALERDVVIDGVGESDVSCHGHGGDTRGCGGTGWGWRSSEFVDMCG